MTARAFLAGLASVFIVVAGASAQTFPSHPVTMIVPYPAGGPTDTLARILADHLKTTLGQPVIVENVSGAGGSVGVARVARAVPDGYTLSIGHWNTHVVLGATMNLNFDVFNDFEPVGLIADTPIWLVARKDLLRIRATAKSTEASREAYLGWRTSPKAEPGMPEDAPPLAAN